MVLKKYLKRKNFEANSDINKRMVTDNNLDEDKHGKVHNSKVKSSNSSGSNKDGS